MPTYRLSPEQQKAWYAWMNELSAPRGRRSQIADDLARTVKGTKKESWKTTLTGFFRGEAKALQAIFDDPKRLRVVAGGLEVPPERLREQLSVVSGQPSADGPFDVRVPGFEDFGPVPALEALFAPIVMSEINLPGEGPSSGRGSFELDQVVKSARPRTPPITAAIVVVGGPGMGKSTLLRAVAARLHSDGVHIHPWTPGIPIEGGVIYQDDLDLLEPGQRRQLCEAARTGKCVLLTSTTSGDALLDLPSFRAVYSVCAGYQQWSLGYLDHLEQLIRRRWERKVSFLPLRAWIEDDPFGEQLAGRIDNLGLLARHAADGGQPPAALRQLAPMALHRCVEQVRRRGFPDEAELIELGGEGTLQRLAVSACRRGQVAADRQLLLRAFAEAVDAAVPRQGRRAEHRPTEALVPAVERMLAGGLLYRRGDQVHPRQTTYLVSALGAHLSGAPSLDEELLCACVLHPEWRDAPAAAAEHLGDGGPVLSALLRLPAEVLCQAVPTITRLLATAVRFTDRGDYQRAFRLSLSYWARWRADSRSFTLNLTLTPRPAAQAAGSDGLVSGVAPLLVLALASHRHRELLPHRISPEDVQAGSDLPEALREYLALYQREEISLEQARDAVALGAPFQTDLLLKEEIWCRLPPLNRSATDTPGGFKEEDYQRWWRIAAVPRLRAEPDGSSYIAGTHPAMSILSGLTQEARGAEIWRDAILERLRAHDAAAPDAFVEAIHFTLTRGGRVNEETLRFVWEAAPGRDGLRERVAETLQALDVNKIWSRDGFLGWVLGVVVGEETRASLFDAWIQAVPALWQTFLKAGLPPARVARWALEAERGEEPGAALMELARSDDLEVLELVYQAGSMLASEEALRRLCGMYSPDARRLRLRLAVGAHMFARLDLLRQMVPQQGEDELWLKLAESAETWAQGLLGWAAWALVTPAEDPWGPTLEWLVLLDALLVEDDAAAWAQARPLFGDGDDEKIRQIFQRMRAETRWGRGVSLEELAGAVHIARERGRPDPRPVVERLFELPQARRVVLGGGTNSLWRAAVDLLGLRRVVQILEEDHSAEMLTAARLAALFDIGQEAAVRSLLVHPRLGPDAARVLAARIYTKEERDLLEVLEGLPLVQEGAEPTPHPATWALVEAFRQRDAGAALRWLQERLQGEARAVQVAWWRELVPRIAAGPLRAEALARYLDARRLGQGRGGRAPGETRRQRG